MERLENKSKVQLLDIIDRKDNVERSLRDMIETLNNAVETEKVKYNDVVKRFNNLKKDMDGMCVELDNTRKQLENAKKRNTELDDMVNNLDYNCDTLFNSLKENEFEYDNLKDDYQNICDILATERAEHHIAARNYFIVNAILMLALIVIVAFYISYMY